MKKDFSFKSSSVSVQVRRNTHVKEKQEFHSVNKTGESTSCSAYF